MPPQADVGAAAQGAERRWLSVGVVGYAGHAETESPDDPAQYSEALTIADMAALMDMLGIEKAVVGGLSLGGFMSLAFQLAHPERVRALLLCDTGPGYRSDEARAKWNRMAERSAANFEEKGLDAAGRSPEVQAAVKLHKSAAGLAHSARGMLAQVDSRVIDHLPEIDVPDADHRGGEGRAVPRRLAATCSRRSRERGWRSFRMPDTRRTWTSRRRSTGWCWSFWNSRTRRGVGFKLSPRAANAPMRCVLRRLFELPACTDMFVPRGSS